MNTTPDLTGVKITILPTTMRTRTKEEYQRDMEREAFERNKSMRAEEHEKFMNGMFPKKDKWRISIDWTVFWRHISYILAFLFGLLLCLALG